MNLQNGERARQIERKNQKESKTTKERKNLQIITHFTNKPYIFILILTSQYWRLAGDFACGSYNNSYALT